jgi:hypothetical protein
LVSDAGFDGIVIHLKHFDRLEFQGSTVACGGWSGLRRICFQVSQRWFGRAWKDSRYSGHSGGALAHERGRVRCRDFLTTCSKWRAWTSKGIIVSSQNQKWALLTGRLQ